MSAAPDDGGHMESAAREADDGLGRDFLVSVWQADKGLPANLIQALAQTPDGFLWLGTHQGLVRFDGVRFQTFFSIPAGLRYGVRVDPLAVDDRGRLWAVPDQVGFVCREAGGFTEVLTNGAVLQARAESLCSDGQGRLLWVDAGGRLGQMEAAYPAQAEAIDGKIAPGARWVRDFQGGLWLAAPRALWRYDHGKWIELEPPGGPTQVVTPRREGGLWLASRGKLQVVNTTGEILECAAFSWSQGARVTQMLEDSSRRLWIGTSSEGLFCRNTGGIHQVWPTSSAILCLLEDSQGEIWVGTRGNGLARVRSRRFFMHNRVTGLVGEFVRSLCEDGAGRVWAISSEGAPAYWQSNQWRRLDGSTGWTAPESLSVIPAAEGGVWISTTRRELWRWRDGRAEKQAFDGELRNPAADLLEDRQSRVWMVTDNSGLYCLEGRKLTGYSRRDGLPSDRIRRLLQDDKGRIWAGDWEGGVSLWNSNGWSVLRQQSGHRDAIRSMVWADGALWIGTSAGGLLRFKDGQTVRISTAQGLPNDCVQQLLPDGRGALWGCAPHRLFRLPLAQLNSVVNEPSRRVDPVVYGREDGLPETSFAAWHDPRCWRARDGKLWFATASGALHFRVDSLPETRPPQVLIERVLVNGKPAAPDDLRGLRPVTGRVEFQFVAPCLAADGRVRYRYQLDGVDPDWVEAGAQTSAIYASLPAGNRAFRVAARSPEGVWSSEPATLSLVCRAYFWQTEWFFALAAAATAGGGVWLAKRATLRRLNRRIERLRQQHALDEERARIARDIHDELGANLTSIGLMADLGARHKAQPAAVEEELRQISQTARESVAAMDAIVWALNPRHNSLDHFANYLAQYARDFFRPAGLRVRLDLPADLPPCPLSAERRHELFLIIKECFNNIVRHAAATEARLALSATEGCLRLTIADDGGGLAPGAPTAGQDGLDNARRRIERLGGTLRIRSEAERGTRLEFTLPLEAARANSCILWC